MGVKIQSMNGSMRGREGLEQGVGIVVASPDEYGDLSLGDQGGEDGSDAGIDFGDEFSPSAQGFGSLNAGGNSACKSATSTQAQPRSIDSTPS